MGKESWTKEELKNSVELYFQLIRCNSSCNGDHAAMLINFSRNEHLKQRNQNSVDMRLSNISEVLNDMELLELINPNYKPLENVGSNISKELKGLINEYIKNAIVNRGCTLLKRKD